MKKSITLAALLGLNACEVNKEADLPQVCSEKAGEEAFYSAKEVSHYCNATSERIGDTIKCVIVENAAVCGETSSVIEVLTNCSDSDATENFLREGVFSEEDNAFCMPGLTAEYECYDVEACNFNK